MDDTQLDDGTCLTVNYFPVITVILIVFNIVVFFATQAVVPATNPLNADKAALQCLKTNYPQCLTQVSQKEYIQCGSDLIMRYKGLPADQVPFESCLYDVKAQYKTDSAIINKCCPSENQFYYQFAFTPAVFGSGHKLWTVITSMFLHGNWSHLINNMIGLLLAGMFVETRIGNSKKFLLFYLLTGIAANVFYLLLNQGSPIPALGASGAIFGLLGANLILDFYKTKTNFIPTIFGRNLFAGISVPYLVIIFIMQVFGNFSNETGIGYAAHIGGFISGAILIFYLKKKDDTYTPQPIR